MRRRPSNVGSRSLKSIQIELGFLKRNAILCYIAACVSNVKLRKKRKLNTGWFRYVAPQLTTDYEVQREACDGFDSFDAFDGFDGCDGSAGFDCCDGSDGFGGFGDFRVDAQSS